MSLTHEDIVATARVYRSYGMRDAVRADDNVDYRAMLAREAWRERMWRVGGTVATPEGLTLMDAVYGSLRVYVERINGEPLA